MQRGNSFRCEPTRRHWCFIAKWEHTYNKHHPPTINQPTTHSPTNEATMLMYANLHRRASNVCVISYIIAALVHTTGWILYITLYCDRHGCVENSTPQSHQKCGWWQNYRTFTSAAVFAMKNLEYFYFAICSTKTKSQMLTHDPHTNTQTHWNNAFRKVRINAYYMQCECMSECRSEKASWQMCASR